MIVFMGLCYVAILAVLVKLNVVKLNLWWKLSPVIFILICLVLLILPMQWGAPMGTVNVYQYVVEIIPNVSGNVLDVSARPLQPMKQGDVLFTIDPQEYQAEVDRLEAAVDEAEQAAKMLPVDLAAAKASVAQAEAELVEAKQQAESLRFQRAAAEAAVAKFQAQLELSQAKYDRARKLLQGNAIAEEEVEELRRSLEAAQATLDEAKAKRDQAQLAIDSQIGGVNTIVVHAEQALRAAQAAQSKSQIALESTIHGEHTSVVQLRAQLAAAKLHVEHTTVHAPADGNVIGLALRPGQRVAEHASVTFVETSNTRLAVFINQHALRHVQPGQPAEVTFKISPGQTFPATVEAIAYTTPAGQLQPGGEIPTAPDSEEQKLPFGVILVIDADEFDASQLPGGAAGTAAIYTGRARATHIIRRVELRMQAWLNYIFS
jgi:multidrug resistance efflux pump